VEKRANGDQREESRDHTFSLLNELGPSFKKRKVGESREKGRNRKSKALTRKICKAKNLTKEREAVPGRRLRVAETTSRRGSDHQGQPG